MGQPVTKGVTALITDTTTTNEPAVWTAWPEGGQIEQTDSATWIWTGKRIAGKHLIVRPEMGIQSGWYRLLTPDELGDYTYLEQRALTNEYTIVWMLRAAQMDAGRLSEIQTRNTMQGDWALLNEALNEYADGKGLCGEYERQLSEWNDSFAVMSLEGRAKTYEVELTITATYTTTVEVEATSEDEATDKAGDLDWDEVTRGLDINDASDMNWQVESAGVQ